MDNPLFLILAISMFPCICVALATAGFVMGYKTPRQIEQGTIFCVMIVGAALIFIGGGLLVKGKDIAEAVIGIILFSIGFLPAMSGLGALIGGKVLPDSKDESRSDSDESTKKD